MGGQQSRKKTDKTPLVRNLQSEGTSVDISDVSASTSNRSSDSNHRSETFEDENIDLHATTGLPGEDISPRFRQDTETNGDLSVRLKSPVDINNKTIENRNDVSEENEREMETELCDTVNSKTELIPVPPPKIPPDKLDLSNCSETTVLKSAKLGDMNQFETEKRVQGNTPEKQTRSNERETNKKEVQSDEKREQKKDNVIPAVNPSSPQYGPSNSQKKAATAPDHIPAASKDISLFKERPERDHSSLSNFADANIKEPLKTTTTLNFKKRVTKEQEDNRSTQDHPEMEFHGHGHTHTLLTNVIFLPDKSKGASPKRFGPKRLGSVQEGELSVKETDFPEDIGDLNETDEELETELKASKSKTPKSEVDIKNVTDQTVLDKFIPPDNDSGQLSISHPRTYIPQEPLNSDTNRVYLNTFNNPENIIFVEDHFGLYTGLEAAGFAKEFQVQGSENVNESLQNETVRETHSKVSVSKTESEKEKSSKLEKNVVANNLPQDKNLEFKNVQIESQKENQHLSPCPNGGTDKAEKIENTELREAEFCPLCKESVDICSCLFPSPKVRTVMSVTESQYKRPTFSFERFLKIGDKDIDWLSLKSEQAVFIRDLKSMQTNIGEDNRVAFEFKLPVFKALSSKVENISFKGIEKANVNDDDASFDDGEDNALSISSEEQEIPRVRLVRSGSIDSNKHLMYNDFDECSDEEIFNEVDNSEEKVDPKSQNQSECSHVTPQNGPPGELNDSIDALNHASDSGFCSDNLEKNETVRDMCEREDNKTLIAQISNKVKSNNQSECAVEQAETQTPVGSVSDSGLGNDLPIPSTSQNCCLQEKRNVDDDSSRTSCSEASESAKLDGQKTFIANYTANHKQDPRLVWSSASDNHNGDKNASDCKETSTGCSVDQEHINTSNGLYDPSLKSATCNINENNVSTNTVKLIQTEDIEINHVDSLEDESNVVEMPFECVKHGCTDDDLVERSLDSKKIKEHQDNVSRNEEIPNPSIETENDYINSFEDQSLDVKVSVENEHIDGSLAELSLNNSKIKEHRDPESRNEEIPNPSIATENDYVNSLDDESMDVKVSINDVENEHNDGSLDKQNVDCATLNTIQNDESKGKENIIQTKDVAESSGKESVIHTEDVAGSNDKESVIHTKDDAVNTLNLLSGEPDAEEVHVDYVLKSKNTPKEEDNRFVYISSDEETEYDSSINMTSETKSNFERCENEVEIIPANIQSEDSSDSDSSGIGGNLFEIPRSLPLFSPLENILGRGQDSGLTANPFMRYLQDRHRGGLSGLLHRFTDDSDLDYTLPPEEFMKRLHERQNKRVNEARRRIPRRPENATSDFAASFYETADPNVDITMLDSVDRQQEPNQGNPDRETTNDGGNDGVIIPAGTFDDQQEARVEFDVSDSSYSNSLASEPTSRSNSPVNTSDNDEVTEEAEHDKQLLNDIWIPVIEAESLKCLRNTSLPKGQRCTVLCIDVSTSMLGHPWKQVKDFVQEFASGLEQQRRENNVEESVAMVTFGCQTKIVLCPTTEYKQICKEIESIEPSGDTPLLPGLALCLLFEATFKELGYQTCRLHEITLEHQIILITDGFPTPTLTVADTDDFPDLIHEEASQEVLTSLEDWKLSLRHFHIDCVPVGEKTNLEFLKSICSRTDGRLVYPNDVQVLVNSTHNNFMTAQISHQLFQQKVDEFNMDLFKSLVKTLYPHTSQADEDEMVKLVEKAHAQLVSQRQDGGGGSGNTSSEEDDHFERPDSDNTPPVGMRVVKGPDIAAKFIDILPDRGTVTGHSRKHKGKVFVHWDNGVRTLNNCRPEKFEVLPADDKQDQCDVDDDVRIGHKVRRGPDWTFENQDGGCDQLGTVFDIQKDGTVGVKWQNGYRGNYRYKDNNTYDVLLSDPQDPFGTKKFETEMNKRNT